MFFKKLLISVFLFAAGYGLVYGGLTGAFSSSSTPAAIIKQAANTVGLREHEVVGFLPYWLLSRARSDYSPYLTTLTYFGLTIQPDGTIQQYTNPGEAEPGWHALNSGLADPFLDQAKAKNLKRSLLVFAADQDTIDILVSEPKTHAYTLVDDVAPIMREYGFTDLNVDIESVAQASESARVRFTEFIKSVNERMDQLKLGTLTIDSSPSDLIHTRLIDLPAVEPYVDMVVLMTYDYHYMGSAVSGPVAPVGGAGTIAEFDVETGVQLALAHIPQEKLLLGVPLYGYSWETIRESTRSATLPGSGLVVSNQRMEEMLAECSTCSAQVDEDGKEAFVVYKDQLTGTYHHAFFPDSDATKSKIALAQHHQLRGIALWALGYEGETILEPLREYKQSLR